MIIYGGFGPSGNLHDVWVLENADGSTGTPNWLALSPLGGPPAASNQAAAAYDPNTNTLMIAGGGNCCTSPTGTFDVWVLRNANGLGGQPQFVKLNPVGTPPTPRYGLVSAYDIASNKLVIFGGGSEEVWVLNNANGIGGTPEFVLLETDGGPPPPRGGVVANPTAVYDEAVKRMTIFGGFAASIGPVNDTWVLDLASSAGPPGAPRSPTPANGASGVALAPTLRWIAGSGATSHDVYFGTTSPPPLVTNTTGTSYVPGKLATGTTYYWKVEAKNANGATPSPVWSFRTKLTPDSPTNPSPANGATGVSRTPTLTWGAAAGATSYDVYFGLASTPAFKVSVTAASFTPASTLLANRLYYWRVVSRSATGTKTGPTWNFRTRP
jgi:hypothetical protein